MCAALPYHYSWNEGNSAISTRISAVSKDVLTRRRSKKLHHDIRQLTFDDPLVEVPSAFGRAAVDGIVLKDFLCRHVAEGIGLNVIDDENTHAFAFIEQGFHACSLLGKTLCDEGPGIELRPRRRQWA